MRISDWSSDVCSSDLAVVHQHNADRARGRDFGGRCGIGDGGNLPGHCQGQATPTSCNFPSSVSRSNGFITYSSAPASIAARIWSMLFSVVHKTTDRKSVV